MKSDKEWSDEVRIIVPFIQRIQSDATADLQAQVEQLRGEVEAQIDSKLRAWKENDDLRTALGKCVVALESCCSFAQIYKNEASIGAARALATAKPLLNKP